MTELELELELEPEPEPELEPELELVCEALLRRDIFVEDSVIPRRSVPDTKGTKYSADGYASNIIVCTYAYTVNSTFNILT